MKRLLGRCFSRQYTSKVTLELTGTLEKGTDEDRLDTLRRLLCRRLMGTLRAHEADATVAAQPTLLMLIIQYIMPSKNKQLKKLLHFYWSNAIQNDLQHPNEYIHAELLEPLISTCRSCLEHRHSYVRKNAVFAVYTIYREYEHLIPDAPELMQTFIAAESDMTCKRNAFVFLAHCAMPKAVEWLISVYDQLTSLDELLQVSIIEVVRLDCKNDTTHRPRYIRCMFELLNSSSHAVKYEAATTLTTLTQNPAAVKTAASCFVNLVIKESDNNVKLIVLDCLDCLDCLDRLDTLRSKHGHILDGLTMDILQVLSSADMEVRRKAMSIVLSMTSNRNVKEVVLFLKKQLQQTQEREFEKAPEYRQLLIQSIHVLAVKFPEVAASVVHALMEFLGDSNNPSALDVVAFVRFKFPHLRPSICDKLTQTLTEIKSGKTFRGVLWIQGRATFQDIRKVIGEIPILASEQRLLDEADGEEEQEGRGKRAAKARSEAVKAASKPPLRALILGGDFFTGSVLASALTKLVLRFDDLTDDRPKANALRAESMLIMTSIIRVGQSKFVTVPIDEDSNERILNCIQTLSELQEKSIVHDIFLKDTKAAHSKMLVAQEKKAAEKKEAENTKEHVVQLDDLLTFRQFSRKSADDPIDYVEDLGKATGAAEVWEDFISNLSRISQLTGFSDPICAEAFVMMHGFDIMLDVLLVNQTSNTLQNLCLDCATLGDLKLVERPAVYTIAPHGFQSIKATIKVSSTETGVIFGSILWDGPALAECCVILNDIHIEIMDYIKPAYCSETQFRSTWTEFEWENMVKVSTNMTDPRDYLKHVMKSMNIIGEDALVNLSIEKTEAGIVGHVRTRSKTQGIALSLSDRITMCESQKDSKSSIRSV
ncbi:coatomer beta C-terminal region-domain-containing protein [Suillus fuscotomentosus]|uniref:Coatomer subunit beta n=1 Tax=Suillus fuscotomentosus TaxID=1912939 RepID=A0AAD4HCC3_9AGAM|nr:coatomer beta C-terminal region-domain-containing protein [Suillus fuscotomentosus]KAG1887545.1 coatomer beta C-terminal region-domain-containing protein [Suillus fuscotomentosus]